MRFPAAICSDLRGVNFSLCIGHFCTGNANLSKILQDVYSNRSRNGVKGWGYYFSLTANIPFFGVSQDTHLSAWLIFLVPYKLTFLWYNNPLQIFFLLDQTLHR